MTAPGLSSNDRTAVVAAGSRGATAGSHRVGGGGGGWKAGDLHGAVAALRRARREAPTSKASFRLCLLLVREMQRSGGVAIDGACQRLAMSTVECGDCAATLMAQQQPPQW